ncbi:Hypothetical predicted protein [Podarcis lilfordi]|uniref:Uncharacterized protein n=1 Tax=Podarcis lilfordi TaxID=74358 RepID=A0AA35K585_9SAUR|nr:Hypothetical predicted protein [Podarcis lilfordi]
MAGGAIIPQGMLLLLLIEGGCERCESAKRLLEKRLLLLLRNGVPAAPETSLV